MNLNKTIKFWITIIICCTCSIILFRKNYFSIGNTYQIKYILNNPNILHINKFLTNDEIDSLVNKLSTNNYINDNDSTILHIKNRITRIINIPIQNIEPFQLITKNYKGQKKIKHIINKTESFKDKSYGMNIYLDKIDCMHNGDIIIWKK